MLVTSPSCTAEPRVAKVARAHRGNGVPMADELWPNDRPGSWRWNASRISRQGIETSNDCHTAKECSSYGYDLGTARVFPETLSEDWMTTTLSIPLSVLDIAMIERGKSSSEALRATVDLSRRGAGLPPVLGGGAPPNRGRREFDSRGASRRSRPRQNASGSDRAVSC